MLKRLTQQERPGEDERVVAKLKPMWNWYRRLPIGLQERWVRVHRTALEHSKQKVQIWISPVNAIQCDHP